MSPGTCIHYTGLSFGQGTCKCKADIDLRATFGGDKRPGLFLRMPCIEFMTVPANGRGTYCKPGKPTIRKEIDRHGEVVIPCALRLEPTAEQVLQDHIEWEAVLEKATAGMKVASTWRVKPRPVKDRSEVVKCPVCKGQLHLSQSSYNGHVHGK